MKRIRSILLATICLGLFGCANVPEQESEKTVPDRGAPPTAKEYWAKRDAEDKAARANDRSRNIKP